MSEIIIAIDGYSACGKSTLAKQVAEHFGYLFIDSGAMYRAVTLFALQNGCVIDGKVNEKALIACLSDVHLEFKKEAGIPRIHLNDRDIEDEIRKGQVPNFVSQVSAIKEVREKLVNEQRAMATLGGVVMDGRDIGTVVFPNAELKIFVTASLEIRIERRFQELKAKGIIVDKSEIAKNLNERDHIDTTRIESPLRQAPDAILMDNTQLTKEEQLKWVVTHVKLLLNKNLS
ncbi:MAG: (d)CMP kinase [Bacteroidetes bacterium]|nr:(d)CMP kinase [Bacteroidota bacterium]